METDKKLLIGTCSWNYDSWKNIVYSSTRKRAAEYLPEYAKSFNTVEIDSWFYRFPSAEDVIEYLAMTGPDFKFTCKVPSVLTLTHHRQKDKSGALRINNDFLSNEKFNSFIDTLEPMLPQLDALIFEFEYLNKQKMPSAGAFIRAIDEFVQFIPADIPLALEVRNGDYLTAEYFQFLKEKNIAHVFSEKIYMPPVFEVYEKYKEFLTDYTVIRLLGGDRKSIEKKTAGKWNRIVEEKDELIRIIEMTRDLITSGRRVTINVNNHYEGSAPLTIEKIRALLKKPIL